MDNTTFVNLIRFTAGFIVICGIFNVTSDTTHRQAFTFRVQSLIIVGFLTLLGIYLAEWEFYIMAGVVLLIKVILIPNYVEKNILVMGIIEEKQNYQNLGVPILICSVLLIIGFSLLNPLKPFLNSLTSDLIGLALGLMMISIFSMIRNTKVTMQLMGILFLENGLNLAIIGFGYTVTLIVEIGIILDMAISVIIMIAFTKQIYSVHKMIDSAKLEELKEQ
jgi:hydrogenase-4 component E